MLTYILLLLPIVFLIGSVAICVKRVENGKSRKSTVLTQIFSFLVVFSACFITPIVTSAATAVDAAATSSNGLGFIAAAAATGLSCIGGGIAVAAAAPAAIGATSEDPKNFGKAIIFVALGEGIALYGMLISIMIISKI